MRRILFDLESDGLLDTLTRIHCIVLKDADTGIVRRFRYHDGNLAEAYALLVSCHRNILNKESGAGGDLLRWAHETRTPHQAAGIE